MVRPMSFLLGFWLAALFVCGQGAHVSQLMVAALALAAGFALLGGFVAPMVGPRLRLAGPVALTVGLVAWGAVGLAMKMPLWLPCCVFMGTFCFIGVTVAEVLWSPRNRGTMAPADS